MPSTSVAFIAVATVAAFLTYSAMYAVRKAFAAGTYSGISFFGLDYKAALVMAQILGYTLSKWIGVKVVAEAGHRRRGVLILSLVGFSTFSLLLFAVLPPAWGILCLFLNGLPIGMVFGLVFGYLEGRRSTEVLVVGLTITQIFSSGLVKSIGRWLLEQHLVTDRWMPLSVALIFTPALLLGVLLLQRLPAPDAKDVVLKSERVTMDRKQRMHFIKTFLPGLVLFMATYILMTGYRDYRDNFAVDIWQDLGIAESAGLVTASEIPAALLILGSMLLLQRVRDNRLAFRWIHGMGIAGASVALLGTLAYGAQLIGPLLWVSLTGVGLYLAYVPANSVFFERMIAVFRYRGNAGFVVILADFFGYCGSFGVLLFKNFGTHALSHDRFFFAISLLVPSAVLLGQLGSYAYYFRQRGAAAVSVQAQQKENIASV